MKITFKAASLFAAFTLAAIAAPQANAATEVVASLPELAAIAKAVGGNDVTVYSIAKPNQDYHGIEARPSDVSRIANADLIVRSGLSLDGWMDSLMNAAGNTRLNRGGLGYVDASAGIPRIELPQGGITGASGDVHPQGNPHYYYDPIYAKRIAQNVVKGLIKVDGKNADDYRKNYLAFNASIDAHMNGWRSSLAPYAGKALVTYHLNYNYFLRRFGIRQYGTLEPKPGIPPSAQHISQLISQMKRDGVKAMLIENIYPRRFADLMGRQLGATPQFGPFSVSSYNGAAYIELIDALVAKTKAALG